MVRILNGRFRHVTHHVIGQALDVAQLLAALLAAVVTMVSAVLIVVLQQVREVSIELIRLDTVELAMALMQGMHHV
jgi:hypothetical protein